MVHFEGNFNDSAVCSLMIAGMSDPYTLPAQLLLEFNPANRLLNASARRVWLLAKKSGYAEPVFPTQTGRIDKASIIANGVVDTLRQCRKLLHKQPLKVVQEYDRTRIVVLGTFEYIVDAGRCRLHVRPLERALDMVVDVDGRPQPVTTALARARLDMVKPLCTPFWLQFLAWRKDGICRQHGASTFKQRPHWSDQPDAVQVLNEICDRVFHLLKRDRDFLCLQAMLTYRLVDAIGERAFSIALHARTNPHDSRLDADQVCRVWRYRTLYERMHVENPRLLPLLTAWLDAFRVDPSPGLTDAVPAIRTQLLSEGLPSKAWRYLCKNGMRGLVRDKSSGLGWRSMVAWLATLGLAGWPDLPPRGFIGLLNDTAGLPVGQAGDNSGVPGWFWNWTCQQAHGCRDDPQAYRQLQDKVAQWAWLVRRYRPHPDANQQRRRLRWLESWANRQEQLTHLSDDICWSDWLGDLPWQRIERLTVVPLLSPRALRREGDALRNCAYRYLSACQEEEYLMLSLRHPESGKRLALLGLKRHADSDEWTRDQISGSCNRPVPSWIRAVADEVVAMVRRGAEREQTLQALLAVAKERQTGSRMCKNGLQYELPFE